MSLYLGQSAILLYVSRDRSSCSQNPYILQLSCFLPHTTAQLTMSLALHMQGVGLRTMSPRVHPRFVPRCSPRINLRLLPRQIPRISPRNYSTQAPPQNGIPINIERELPDPFKEKRKNRMYFWVYAIGITALCAIIFNYEKSSSPIVNSVLYCLRRSEQGKKYLGSNIGFKSSWPWILGPLNTVKGNIDIEFDVKGDLQTGKLHLKASRSSKLVPFDLEAFELVINDANHTAVDLMKDPSMDFEL